MLENSTLSVTIGQAAKDAAASVNACARVRQTVQMSNLLNL